MALHLLPSLFVFASTTHLVACVYYTVGQDWIEKNPRISVAVAAIQTLTSVIKRSKGMIYVLLALLVVVYGNSCTRLMN